MFFSNSWHSTVGVSILYIKNHRHNEEIGRLFRPIAEGITAFSQLTFVRNSLANYDENLPLNPLWHCFYTTSFFTRCTLHYSLEITAGLAPDFQLLPSTAFFSQTNSFNPETSSTFWCLKIPNPVKVISVFPSSLWLWCKKWGRWFVGHNFSIWPEWGWVHAPQHTQDWLTPRGPRRLDRPWTLRWQ